MTVVSKPAVSVLIPAYNGAAWLQETLARVSGAAQGLSCETIVVDNASEDATPEIARAFPGVVLLRGEENRGYSNAINRAVKASQGRSLVVINQDLYVDRRSLELIHDFLASRNAVVAGRLFSRDGTAQPSCGPFPTLLNTIGRLVLPQRIRKYYLRRPFPEPGTGAARVDWATGAFMAFPRALFEAVGGFDEGFFMYYEDVDFCRRSRRKGFPVYYLPALEAVHVAPYAERRNVPDWLRREVRLSQMRYFDTHRPRWEANAIRALNRAYFAAQGWDWPPVGRAAA